MKQKELQRLLESELQQVQEKLRMIRLNFYPDNLPGYSALIEHERMLLSMLVKEHNG